MKRRLLFGLAAACWLAAPASAEYEYEVRAVQGWQLNIRRDFPTAHKAIVARAVKIIDGQLRRVTKTVPEPALSRLREVRIYLTPGGYKDAVPGATYHPDAGWLREHGRDPAMAGGVEIFDAPIMDKEAARMPCFVLHELAHAYHDKVLGSDDAEIEAAYRAALKSGVYDRVERVNWPGQPHSLDRAYALTDVHEYFAESTEAFFGRNDFFPFDRAELKRVDPGMERLLREKWGLPPQ